MWRHGYPCGNTLYETTCVITPADRPQETEVQISLPSKSNVSSPTGGLSLQ